MKNTTKILLLSVIVLVAIGLIAQFSIPVHKQQTRTIKVDDSNRDEILGTASGPFGGGTFANDAATGTIAWVLPGNANASDDIYATFISLGVAGDSSQYLKATNFGFSIPVGSNINGVTAVIEIGHSGAVRGCLDDHSVKLVIAGSVAGNDKKKGTEGATCLVNGYTASGQNITYGSSTDTWGASPTVAQVNASTFGVGYSMSESDGEIETGRVDYITMTVDYSPGSGNFFLLFY